MFRAMEAFVYCRLVMPTSKTCEHLTSRPVDQSGLETLFFAGMAFLVIEPWFLRYNFGFGMQ